MKKIEKYLGNKTYMFPNGVLATPEVMLENFPAILTFAHIIETDEAGEVCFAVENLNAMRSFYNIDSSLSEEEAIVKIEEIRNTPEEVSTEPTAEERTVKALEQIANGQTSENVEALDILLTGEDE
jgi:hypothetical protein